MKMSIKLNTKIKSRLTKAIALFCVVILPALSFSQPPPDPTDNNPDAPFDSNMNLAFLVIGVTFAAVIIWQEVSRRRKLQGSDVKQS